jgi:hypothetical protein
MALSGSTDYSVTLNDIIEDALFELNVIGADENVSPNDFVRAKKALNRLVKQWQAQGFHLWKKKTATIFLQKDQIVYDLFSTGAHAAESYIRTTLGADETSGQTTITVTSSSGMATDDYIGIEQNDNTLHWSTISSIPDGTTVIINDALTDDASSGLKVYAYTIRLDEPFNVFSAARQSESLIDVPMKPLSYQNYFELPNKSGSGTPVEYNYDRQLGFARISVWPVPQNVKSLMKITYAAKIEDLDSTDNNPDFPQEWYDPLVLNLAVKLAPAFGKNTAPAFADLRQQAAESLDLVLRFDNEQGSIYFQPDSQGGSNYMKWGAI